MQLVELDSDKGKLWINPTHVVKIAPSSSDPGVTELFLNHAHEGGRIVVKIPVKKAAEEINRCLK